MRKRKFAWKPPFVLACTLLGGGAWAASVDLTSNVSPPLTPERATMHPLTVEVRFGNNAGTAADALARIELPANLAAVSLAARAGNPSYCVPASAFGNVTAALTDGSQRLSAIMPSLPAGQAPCVYELTFTPVKPVSYDFVSFIEPGAGDVEGNAGSNRSNNAFSISKGRVELEVQKRVLSGANSAPHPDGGSVPFYEGTHGSDITFEVVYTNHSVVDIPLGALASADSGRAGFEDWEGTRFSNIYPQSSLLKDVTCVADLGSNSICGALTDLSGVASLRGTDLGLIDSAFTNQILKAGEKVTITYTRNYQAPYCGIAGIYNSALWHLPETLLDVTWRGGTNTSEIEMNFAQASTTPNCDERVLHWSVDKQLLGIQRAGSTTVDSAARNIENNGDVAVYEITIDLQDARNDLLGNDAGVPALVRSPEIDVYDVIQSLNGRNPSTLPQGSMRQEAFWYGCSVETSPTSQNSAASDCLGLDAGEVGMLPMSSILTGAGGRSVNVALGDKMTLKVGLRYQLNPAPTCKRVDDQLINQVQLRVMPFDASASPYVYAPALERRDTRLNPLSILADLPYCVNLGVNKAVDTQVITDATTPVTFSLTFANNTDQLGPQVISAALAQDPLPLGFTASSATCVTTRGNATVPAGNLVASHIDANNLFSLNIGNMHSGSEVRCEIVGTFGQAGSHHNVATIDLAPNAQALMDAAQLSSPTPSWVDVQDGDMADNLASQNVQALGVQVGLTKDVAPAGTVAPGDTLTYTVKVSNTFANAADGTQVIDAMPAGIASFTWTCSSSGGAICPRATGSNSLNERIATFPSGSELAYVFTAVVGNDARGDLVNTVQAILPNGFASCAPNNTPGPCVATTTTPVLVPATVYPALTVGKTVLPTGSVTTGDTLTYTVKVGNASSVPADGSLVTDLMPTGIESFNWTCTPAGGAVCPRTSGTDALNETVATFPAGASLTYVFNAKVAQQASGDLINTAQVMPPSGGGVCADTGLAGPCSATVTTSVTPSSGGTEVQPVPVLGAWGWIGLLLSVAGIGAVRRRKESTAIH